MDRESWTQLNRLLDEALDLLPEDREAKGTAVVGGVFDVERWFLASLDTATSPFLGLYVSYLLVAFDDIYDIYDSTAEVFRRRYAAILEDRFDMRHFFDDVAAELPPPARDLLKPAYYARVTSDATDPMRVRLRENAVDRWRPWHQSGPSTAWPTKRCPIRRGRLDREAPAARRHDHPAPAAGIRSQHQLDNGDAAGGAVVPGHRVRITATPNAQLPTPKESHSNDLGGKAQHQAGCYDCNPAASSGSPWSWKLGVGVE